MTPAQIAKARYDEAQQILEAWTHRLARAQAHIKTVGRNGGDTLAAKRKLNTTQMHHEDALSLTRIARQQWINTTNQELWPARKKVAA